jgi:hypothetical protein
MLILLFAVAAFIEVGNGQWNNSTAAMMGTSGGSIPVGFGATFIDGEAFYLISMTPEVAFGQLGVGLDLNLRFNTKGKLRAGDYSKFADYLRIIRYIRWAQKGERFTYASDNLITRSLVMDRLSTITRTVQATI